MVRDMAGNDGSEAIELLGADLKDSPIGGGLYCDVFLCSLYTYTVTCDKDPTTPFNAICCRLPASMSAADVKIARYPFFERYFRVTLFFWNCGVCRHCLERL